MLNITNSTGKDDASFLWRKRKDHFLRHLSLYLPGFAFAGTTCVMLKQLFNQNRYRLYILRVKSLREDILDNTIMFDLGILSLIFYVIFRTALVIMFTF